MAQAKFKKGDTVYMIRCWNGKGLFTIRKYTVMSWGAKQATLAQLNEDGAEAKFSKERIYTPREDVGESTDLTKGSHSGHFQLISTDEGYHKALEIGMKIGKAMAEAVVARWTANKAKPSGFGDWEAYCDREMEGVAVGHIIPDARYC